MLRLRRKNKRFKLKGGVELLLLVIVFGFAILISGILTPLNPKRGAITGMVTTFCCDTGSGADCRPKTGPGEKISFKGSEYGLLRTSTVLAEGNVHLKDSGQKFEGKPIIVNSSDTHIISPRVATAECRTEPKDKFLKKIPPPPIVIGSAKSVPYCTSIPDDQIIFVCKKNCHPATCSPIWGKDVTCYGDSNSQYDAYFRLSDVSSPGIPDFVKNCDLSNIPTGVSSNGKQTIVTPPGLGNAKDDLQLNTFGIKLEDSIIPWLSPFCKPAIYLYPENRTNVNVRVEPLGKMTYTIPTYPDGGWDVIAKPDGEIVSKGTSYDYLYYEAQIPDEEIAKPKEGFVVEKKDIGKLLDETLPGLGLNKKESEQFKDYWVKVLPSSPYYFVGIVSENNLNTIAPLSINPKPQTVIRVTLYFEALEKKVNVNQPKINSVKRNGFTVVEWGGIFKRDPKHPFSCFM